MNGVPKPSVCQILREHGAAHGDEELEALLIREERIPDPDDVWKQELLREQQRQPAEGEVLRLDVLLLLGHTDRRQRVRAVKPERQTHPDPHQLHVELRVFLLEFGEDALHLEGDAALRVVQAFDEVVSVLGHQVGEAEERVGLGVLCSQENSVHERVCSHSPTQRNQQQVSVLISLTLPLVVGVRGEGVVNGTHDLIHALNVSDAWVEFGVDEENPLDHFPVRFTAVRQHLVLVGGIQV